MADLARVDQAEIDRDTDSRHRYRYRLYASKIVKPCRADLHTSLSIYQAELSRRFGESTARWLHAAGTGTLEEEVKLVLVT